MTRRVKIRSPGRLPADEVADHKKNSPKCARGWRTWLWHLTPLCVLTLFPIVRVPKLWLILWLSERPRAWDGTGHYALAKIYSQSVFPDTFGWTHAYFAGMPFPNFYPPLFFWLVALLHHTQIVPFAVAFKLILTVSVLLLPMAVWLLAWTVFDRNRLVAIAAGFMALPLLIDYRFYNPVGLNHASTFLIGLYTQPLGFVLLSLWLAVYLAPRHTRCEFILSCLLLALTVLANFFSAITAAVFVMATLFTQIIRYYKTRDAEKRRDLQSTLIVQLVSPLIAICLSLFWLVPMISQYDYFVTRPYTVGIEQLVSPLGWAWYALSALGIWCWLRQPTLGMWPFILTCLALAAAVVFATVIAPSWFPLQSVRFLSMLNFLLAVPVGRLLLACFQLITSRRNRTPGRKPMRQRANLIKHSDVISPNPMTIGLALALFLGAFVLIKPPTYTLSFLPEEGRALIDQALRFAQVHHDGRYLVEVPNFTHSAAALDGRAINSYLGAQDNETVSVVFREASPHALFFNPLVTAFSAFPDNFGVSSVLADDIDFVEQPLAQHIARARFIGVKYLVIVSPEIKNRLLQEQGIGARYDLGPWSIFELRDETPQQIRALPFRPALVVSRLSLKRRQRTELNFTRWSEEQFASGWFDVLLVRSAEAKLDRLNDLDKFGALILESYQYDDPNLAFQRLQIFAQHKALILLSSDDALFQRIQQQLANFPRATIIERVQEEPGAWLQFEWPTFRYSGTAIRKQWEQIRQILDENKLPVIASSVIATRPNKGVIHINLSGSSAEDVPVLIPTTYHPNWQRDDGKTVYAATPFFMVTLVRQPVDLRYGRRWFESIAVVVSALTVVLLCCIPACSYVYVLGKSKRRKR